MAAGEHLLGAVNDVFDARLWTCRTTVERAQLGPLLGPLQVQLINGNARLLADGFVRMESVQIRE